MPTLAAQHRKNRRVGYSLKTVDGDAINRYSPLLQCPPLPTMDRDQAYNIILYFYIYDVVESVVALQQQQQQQCLSSAPGVFGENEQTKKKKNQISSPCL